MKYTFESFDTQVVGGRLKLPHGIFKTEDRDILVFPSTYMTVRISDRAHFEAAIDATEKLPEKHRRTIRQLMFSKSVEVTTTSAAAEAAVHLMRDIYRDKANFRGKDSVVNIRVENCGEYAQITVIE